MGDGYRSLANEIINKIEKRVSGSIAGAAAELGTVSQNNNLKLDGFRYEIADYLIAVGVTLQPGDRVLTVPVNNGQDVVVLCKVVTRT